MKVEFGEGEGKVLLDNIAKRTEHPLLESECQLYNCDEGFEKIGRRQL